MPKDFILLVPETPDAIDGDVIAQARAAIEAQAKVIEQAQACVRARLKCHERGKHRHDDRTPCLDCEAGPCETFGHRHDGHEGEHACHDCEGKLWGIHGHLLDDRHGEPHYITCDDCGVTLGTRQLPVGIDPTNMPSGLLCRECGQGRADEAERRSKERVK